MRKPRAYKIDSLEVTEVKAGGLVYPMHFSGTT